MTVHVKERKHPKGLKLSEALAEDAPRLKAMKGLVDKKATLIAAADDPAVAEELKFDSLTPTPEQLGRINQFTRSEKKAEEVAAFKTLSCNDIIDRDDDQFSTACVKSFAQLEQPFSPTGKSFMMDHEYTVNNQIGRIFGTETKKISGNQWLLNEVYVPNTEKNASYLQDVDFGIHWAVSVGVVLGKTECTVCQSPFSSWGWWCIEGHDKGAYYDPKSEETDSWGYPVPCDPSTKGAIKCVRQFDNPIDMYELSQVFLGAQYFAALDKDPNFKNIMKAAGANVPIIGLTEDEAAKLPLSHEPAEVSEARLKHKMMRAEDGSLIWTDDKGIRWCFDPEEAEEGVMSLGKATDEDDDSEEENEDGNSEEQLSEGNGNSSDDEGSESESDDESGDGGTGSEGDQAPAGSEQSGGESSEVEDEDDGEEKGLSKDKLLAAVKRANLSDSALAAVTNAKGSGLNALLQIVGEESSALREKVVGLETKATLGDSYLEELRASAIDWYVKAHQSKDVQKVSTDNFQKILTSCGDDADLIKVHIEEQQKTARQLFPQNQSVRRSSFPSDPNEKPELTSGETFKPDDVHDEDGKFGKKIRNIHG